MSDTHNSSRDPTPTKQTSSTPDTSGPEPSTSSRLFQLSRNDQRLVAAAAVLALLLMGMHWARLSGWGMQPVEIEQLPHRKIDYRININRAELVEWMQLGGIGETLATRILEDRHQNGPFLSIDDLQRVKGIGPKTIEKLRPWLMIDTNPNDVSIP